MSLPGKFIRENPNATREQDNKCPKMDKRVIIEVFLRYKKKGNDVNTSLKLFHIIGLGIHLGGKIKTCSRGFNAVLIIHKKGSNTIKAIDVIKKYLRLKETLFLKDLLAVIISSPLLHNKPI